MVSILLPVINISFPDHMRYGNGHGNGYENGYENGYGKEMETDLYK